MKIKIKKIENDVELPVYHTAGAAGFDLRAHERIEIAPHAIGYVPLGVAMQIPEGHFLLLAARSSLHKRGLMMASGVGILDSDFCGDDDQPKATLLNFTDAPVVVLKGDRLVQGVIVPFVRAEWEEVQSMESKSRGGFGTTGTA